MGYSGILGYGILEFILGYKLNQFWDMGYIGRFILGYGILPTPLNKTPWFVSDLFRNHTVGFLVTRLKCCWVLVVVFSSMFCGYTQYLTNLEHM